MAAGIKKGTKIILSEGKHPPPDIKYYPNKSFPLLPPEDKSNRKNSSREG